MAEENSGIQNDDLLNAFRTQYQYFSVAIPGAIQSNVDPVSLARLGDDLDEYHNLAHRVRHASFLRYLCVEYLSLSTKTFSLPLSFRY